MKIKLSQLEALTDSAPEKSPPKERKKKDKKRVGLSDLIAVEQQEAVVQAPPVNLRKKIPLKKPLPYKPLPPQPLRRLEKELSSVIARVNAMVSNNSCKKKEHTEQTVRLFSAKKYVEYAKNILHALQDPRMNQRGCSGCSIIGGRYHDENCIEYLSPEDIA